MTNVSLEAIKMSLRIRNTNSFDDEIIDLIEAAEIDLLTSGVVIKDKSDKLYQQAIKSYCRANFALDNKDSEKFQNSYESIKNKMALCKEYQINE